MTTVLVTGADRGIGAALARGYQARGYAAIAACLGDGGDLAASGLQVEPFVDVTDEDSLARLRERLGTTRLEVLISNAGAFTADSWDTLDYTAMHRLFDVNALGPLRVVRALSSLLRNGSKVGIITSRVGSLGDNGSGGMYGYRMSKAAANMAGVNLYHELRPRGISVVLLHPGQVATEVTRHIEGLTGFITPDEAAAGLITRMDALGPDTPPEFRHSDGSLLVW